MNIRAVNIIVEVKQCFVHDGNSQICRGGLRFKLDKELSNKIMDQIVGWDFLMDVKMDYNGGNSLNF